jgi:hypothetical protein
LVVRDAKARARRSGTERATAGKPRRSILSDAKNASSNLAPSLRCHPRRTPRVWLCGFIAGEVVATTRPTLRRRAAVVGTTDTYCGNAYRTKPPSPVRFHVLDDSLTMPLAGAAVQSGNPKNLRSTDNG